jgi:hypothetical protein
MLTGHETESFPLTLPRLRTRPVDRIGRGKGHGSSGQAREHRQGRMNCLQNANLNSRHLSNSGKKAGHHRIHRVNGRGEERLATCATPSMAMSDGDRPNPTDGVHADGPPNLGIGLRVFPSVPAMAHSLRMKAVPCSPYSIASSTDYSSSRHCRVTSGTAR